MSEPCNRCECPPQPRSKPEPEAANCRYLEALAAVTGRTPLYQEAQTVCRPVFINGKR